MRCALSASAGTLVWMAILACYVQVCLTSAIDDSSLSKQSDDSNSQMDMSKRSWDKKLPLWGKRAWQNLQGGWGKRDLWGPSASYPLYSAEKRAWNKLQGAWGKRFAPEDEYAMKQLAALLDEDEQSAQYVPEFGPETEMDSDDEKRAWRSLNGGGWGKRSDWSSFKGSWGKRDPAWTNLKGIWGKRSVPTQ